MRVVSPLFKRVVYPGLSRAGFLRQRRISSVSAITYHGVFPQGYRTIDPRLDGNLIAVENLRKQIHFFKRNYEVISPVDLRKSLESNYQLPPRTLLLTCDDGLKNHLSAMLPVLREAAVKCLFFITAPADQNAGRMLWHERLYLQLLTSPRQVRLEISDIDVFVHASGMSGKRALWRKLLDRLSTLTRDQRMDILEQIRFHLGLPESWDKKYREEPALAERFQTLTASEVKQLAAAGMTVGAHTSSHSKLSVMPAELVVQEMKGNRRQLEQIVGTQVWALAYPFGDFSSVSAREFSLAAECGFSCAFLNYEGESGEERSPFALPRVHVTADMGMSELEARISGFHASLRGLLA